MIYLQYGILILVVGVILALYFAYFKRKNKLNKLPIFTKILAILLAIVFFVRYMTGPDQISSGLALSDINFDNGFFTFVSLIFNWILYANILLICIGHFFKNKTVENIIKFFALPITLLSVVALIPMSIGIVGRAEYFAFNFRAILMSIEVAIVIGYSIILFLEKGKFSINKKEALNFLYIIPMLLAVMPSYMLKALFGLSTIGMEIKGFSVLHRIILYISIALPVIIYFILRKKPKETIRLVLLYIAVGTLLTFSLTHKFEAFLDITRWPFHLCNTAMYLSVICLFFKWDKLFYFTYFINVMGAFLAMIMPNYSSDLNMLSQGVVGFYVNHFIAFFMPILMVALGVYKRPKLKTFIYSCVGFTIYFVLILILNAWFSNYASVDYFFVNSDFIADKLGTWAERLRDIKWQFTIANLKFVFYPVYQFLFYLVYIVLSLIMWFLYEWSYVSIDLLKDMFARKKKIKLDELALKAKLGNKSKEVPMNPEEMNKIVLKNFTKRYGNNKYYAVKDASLVINGGEIFGFLGPNGAGKSTIIKSIVGIQTITDGQITVCGYDVDKQSVMAKRQIGFVPDNYALYEKLTGREYINYIADLYDVSQEDRNNRIKMYVERFELKDSFDSPIRTYSHGMKQKIAIMSALVHNPKIWILDEPLTGLDPNSIFQVKECMKQHASEGNVVFFSSHIIDVVERICDRIAIIKKGKILLCKSVEEIEKEQTLEKFYMDTVNNTNVENSIVEEEPLIEEEIKTDKKKPWWKFKRKKDIESKNKETSSEEANTITKTTIIENGNKVCEVKKINKTKDADTTKQIPKKIVKATKNKKK